MAPGAALTAHPGTTHIQTDVIKQHQHPLRRDFIKIRRLGHCVAAQVHHGLWLHQQAPLSAQAHIAHPGVGL